MIFAHGPLAVLATLMMLKTAVVRRRAHRSNDFSRHDVFLFGVMGFIGGIFPDIDILYDVFVDASRPHRVFLTHTPVLYFVIILVVVLLTWKRRTARLFLFVASFVVGAFSHLFADSIGGKIMWLFPISHRFMGFADFGIPFVNGNLLFYNFFAEGIVLFFFFSLLIHHRLWLARTKKLLWIANGIVFVLGVVTILIVNQHVYHASCSVLDDSDGDQILDMMDRDMDGDGVPNAEDRDANNNGVPNDQELSMQAQRFEGVWQDPTNGGLIEVPLHVGFITRDDTPRRLLQTVGIFLRQEMDADFTRTQEGYVVTPQEATFDRNIQNIRTWLRHQSLLYDAHDNNDRFVPGALVFFASGHFAVVTQRTDDGKVIVLDVHSHRRVQQRPLADVAALEGAVVEVGMLMQAGE